MPRNSWIAIFSAILMSSCTLGPDYHRPQVYKDESFAKSLNLQTQAPKMEIKKDWYKQFQDDSLNKLIEISLHSSPNVNVAVQRLHEARASLNIAQVKMLPKVNANGSYNYVKDSQSYGIPLSTDYYQTGLDASWEIDIWGSGRRLSESQEALYKGAAANLDNVLLSLTAEVANNYISMRSLQDQLAFMQDNLNLQQDIYEMVEAKHKAGLADDIALNQARYALEDVNSQIPVLKTGIENYKNALSVLSGKLPGELETWLQPQKSLIRKKINYPLAQIYNLPVSVVRNRPDVRAVEQNLIAQNALVGQAMAQLFPSVSLSGFFGFQFSKIHGLVDSSNRTYSYSPAISLPLLNWGELSNNVELQKYKTLENFYLYQSSLLNAAADIKNAFTNIEEEYKHNDSLRRQVISQKEVAALTLEKYRQGLVAFDDVLTSRQNLISSQRALIASNGDIYAGITAFYKAIGGGYEAPVEKTKEKTCAACSVAAD